MGSATSNWGSVTSCLGSATFNWGSVTSNSVCVHVCVLVWLCVCMFVLCLCFVNVCVSCLGNNGNNNTNNRNNKNKSNRSGGHLFLGQRRVASGRCGAAARQRK